MTAQLELPASSLACQWKTWKLPKPSTASSRVCSQFHQIPFSEIDM